jgi:hypothetical protein
MDPEMGEEGSIHFFDPEEDGQTWMQLRGDEDPFEVMNERRMLFGEEENIKVFFEDVLLFDYQHETEDGKVLDLISFEGRIRLFNKKQVPTTFYYKMKFNEDFTGIMGGAKEWRDQFGQVMHE